MKKNTNKFKPLKVGNNAQTKGKPLTNKNTFRPIKKGAK